MEKEEKYIRIGYFDNFRGEDSILISADIYGLLELEKLFEKLSNNSSCVNLKELKYIDKNFCLDIIAFCDEENSGLIEIIPNYYEWRVSKEKWSDFRMKTTAIYRDSVIGRNYLDSNSNENKDLQVVISLGEYSFDFWKKY